MSVENTHYGAEAVERMLTDCRSIFFIGIGGVSMSSLAHITKLRGISVSGSDRSRSAITDRLTEEGIEVFYAHRAENLHGCGAVVYTIAISPDNPEYIEAVRLGLPLISRADYLGYVMTGYRTRLAVSGMHGKSTCTSMCAAVMMEAGKDPTVLSGADYPAMGGYSRIGGADGDFIFEACEYRDSFLDFNPTTAIILNIELEHVDYFNSLEQIVESFAAFVGRTGEQGCAIINADDPNCWSAVSNFDGRVVTFGLDRDAGYSARNILTVNGRPTFDIYKHGKQLLRTALRVPGRHNIYNALATAAAASEAGIDGETIARGLAAFTGARRRMEYRGRCRGAEVYDDYGHHPTEITATLRGARSLGGKRLVCAFQPHTYSRTATLFADFRDALSAADVVLLAPIYAARESDDLGVSSKKLADAIGERARACESARALVQALTQELETGDTLVVMGAGDIDCVCDMLEYEAD